MHTDGQLYKEKRHDEGAMPPPGLSTVPDAQDTVCVCNKKSGRMSEDLMLIGIIILLMSDKADMPLIIALVYILMAK